MTEEKKDVNDIAGDPGEVNKQRPWREICEQLLKEKQTENVDHLLKELAQALERRKRD
jgi:hypothetical protein